MTLLATPRPEKGSSTFQVDLCTAPAGLPVMQIMLMKISTLRYPPALARAPSRCRPPFFLVSVTVRKLAQARRGISLGTIEEPLLAGADSWSGHCLSAWLVQ
jgi:hypothetical protein